MVEQESAELFASNQVIGEAYIAVQHHYGVPKAAARSALTGALTSGLVAPLNGQAVLTALAESTGPGLLGPVDRRRLLQIGVRDTHPGQENGIPTRCQKAVRPPESISSAPSSSPRNWLP